MNKLTKNSIVPVCFILGMIATAHADPSTVGGVTIMECAPFENENVTNFCSPSAITLYQKVIAKPVNNFADNMTLLYFRSEVKEAKALVHNYAVLNTKTKTVYPFYYTIFKLKSDGTVDNSKIQPKVYISPSQALCMKDRLNLENDGEINKSYESGIRTKEDKKEFRALCFSFDANNGFDVNPIYPFLPQNAPAGFKIPVGF